MPQLNISVPPELWRNLELLTEIAIERGVFAERAKLMNGTPVHPMRLVHELQETDQ
jgi:hypothetical protein